MFDPFNKKKVKELEKANEIFKANEIGYLNDIKDLNKEKDDLADFTLHLNGLLDRKEKEIKVLETRNKKLEDINKDNDKTIRGAVKEIDIHMREIGNQRAKHEKWKSIALAKETLLTDKEYEIKKLKEKNARQKDTENNLKQYVAKKLKEKEKVMREKKAAEIRAEEYYHNMCCTTARKRMTMEENERLREKIKKVTEEKEAAEKQALNDRFYKDHLLEDIRAGKHIVVTSTKSKLNPINSKGEK